MREMKRPNINRNGILPIRRRKGETYYDLFGRLHAPLIGYYRSWTYDPPMVITSEREQELAEMHRVLRKACAHYAAHYRDFLDLIPYEDRVLELLAYVEGSPFEAGTARPDFIIGEDGSLLICEITARFFGNGYFLSFFNECAGQAMAEEAGITDRRSYFEEMLAYFAAKPGEARRLTVLASADKSDSIGLYVPFYTALGLSCTIIPAGKVEDSLHKLPGSFIVSALNQKDLLSFSDATLRRLADLGMRNDFRSIFLLHDKRFFRLFDEPRFTRAALTEEETAFLRAHAITTYLPAIDSDMFAEARRNKDAFILKHRCLGKSERVYAGCLTDQAVWEELFTSGDVADMILQPFIRQRPFTTVWKNEIITDFVSGTILSVDDRFFGTGLFRTSSRPVINQTDAHKISPLITDQGQKLKECFYL